MKAVEELQAKLNALMEELDFKMFRPAQVSLSCYTGLAALFGLFRPSHPPLADCLLLPPRARNTASHLSLNLYAPLARRNPRFNALQNAVT